MAISEEDRERLKEQYGGDRKTVFVEKEECGAFVFSKPTAVKWERCFSALCKETKGSKGPVIDQAYKTLCRDCLVYPTAADGKPDYVKMESLWAEYPAIHATIGGALADLAGAGEDHAGKL